MRKVVGGVVIDNRKILLVKKIEHWVTPGGKPSPEESDEVCLRREISEELSGTQIKNIRPYKTFEGKSPHKKDMVRVKYYFAEIDGNLGMASREISDSGYYGVSDCPRLADPTSKLIKSLKADGLID